MIRKHMKKIVLTAVIVGLIVIAVSLCSFMIGKLNDDSFYVRSSQYQGDSTVDEVIDFYSEHSEISLYENPAVTFSMGLGGFATEDYEVYVTVEAPGCKINGVEDTYRKDYPDFHEEKYRVEYTGFASLKTSAKYHEDLVIDFPDNRKAGTIVMQLHIMSDRANYYSTREIEVTYTISGSRLHLISEE